jgi:hypothetical protein
MQQRIEQETQTLYHSSIIIISQVNLNCNTPVNNRISHGNALGYNKSMKYDTGLINKVRELRSTGNTYSEIFKALNVKVPKGTISGWCRGIKMPFLYKGKIEKLNQVNLKAGRKIALVSNKAKREKWLDEVSLRAQTSTRNINDSVLKIALAFLYLGEGSKWKSHRGLTLGSSSKEIILLYIKLLNVCYGIESKELKCRVSYRADQNIMELQKYWSALTNIPLNNFYKTIPDPRTIGKPTKDKSYRGVCVIMTSHTEIQLELEMIPQIILKGL